MRSGKPLPSRDLAGENHMRTINVATLIALLAATCVPTVAAAQGSPPVEPAYKPTTTFHGESPPLSELARNPVPVAFANGQLVDAHLGAVSEASLAAKLAKIRAKSS